MALSFKLPAPPERFYRTDEGSGEYLKGWVQDAIMLTMATGVGNLKTDADCIEHWARCRFLSAAEGHVGEAFTVEQALSLKGLSTNVSAETEAAFLKKIGKSVMRDLRRFGERRARQANEKKEG